MTKSTSRKVQCGSCGVVYFAKKPHTCDLSKIKTGKSNSQPHQGKSRKLMFGKKS